MPNDTFTWSKSKRQYYRNGETVSDDELNGWIHQTVDKAMDRIEQLSRRYVAGEINHAEWVIDFKAEIKKGLRGMAHLANGGELDPRTLGALGAAVREQYKFLDRFASAVENGDVKLGPGLIARSKMYADGFWGQYQNFQRLREEEAGMAYERLVLGAAQHCPECQHDANRGFVKIGTLKPLGSRQCLSRCRCHFEYTMRAAGAVA